MPKTLATATVDRLLHHAHVLITDGADSYRLAQATFTPQAARRRARLRCRSRLALSSL
jgi:hypothetical protein